MRTTATCFVTQEGRPAATGTARGLAPGASPGGQVVWSQAGRCLLGGCCQLWPCPGPHWAKHHPGPPPVLTQGMTSQLGPGLRQRLRIARLWLTSVAIPGPVQLSSPDLSGREGTTPPWWAQAHCHPRPFSPVLCPDKYALKVWLGKKSKKTEHEELLKELHICFILREGERENRNI